ncbi:Trehalose 6-phosphatase [Nostocoides japonicum T1-X7]|uniref:Trehalose 6-phosphate phosphatase n=1 Tax=Nostocoides japonicum T1-X7 TaxID=1194083 RepID=A0A077M099_9MICO|nr:trehalose-phosphatase [Tetrasphaera japonica]CCH78547.1 Trehalose 6-phosphatase [Tetrasphaera japonica T1-X7]
MVPPGLTEALSEAAGLPRLVVSTDFDGVLAPIVQDPTTSRALPGTLDSLRALAAHEGVHVAVVSGRDLATLSGLTGIPTSGPITLVGSHGAESSRTPAHEGLTPSETAVLTRLQRQVRAIRHDAPGARVEYKPTAVVVHTRGLPQERAAAVTAAARALGRQPGVHVKKGKSVVELTVVPADKGSAVMDLAADVAADGVCYLGDDATDEDVFARLGPHDVGIKVGPGDTAARWRVDGPDDVAEVLHLLAAACSSRPSSSPQAPSSPS